MYGRRNTDGEIASYNPSPGEQLSWAFLSQFLFRYLAIALLTTYYWLAGDVAHGLLSLHFMLSLCGVYVVVNTIIMVIAIFRPGALHFQSSFWFDCACITVGIAHDPYASIPIILLLFQSLVDNGLHHGFKAYRRGLFIAGLTLAAGLGLRTQTDIGLQMPGLWLSAVAVSIAAYMYVLLKRNDAYQTELYKSGHKDELTGLLNRRALYERARTLFVELGQNKHAVVMFADMDNLKTYNDEHGHVFGDSVIQAAGHAIGACLRDHDIAARYGGDEFVAIFSDIDIVGARQIAERLQHSAAKKNLQVTEARVTLSIGLVQVTGPNANFDIALQRADAALYAAKERKHKGAIVTALTAS